jgi:hypothetical protein
MHDEMYADRETLAQAWQMRRLRRRLIRGAIICGALAIAAFTLAQFMGAVL